MRTRRERELPGDLESIMSKDGVCVRGSMQNRKVSKSEMIFPAVDWHPRRYFLIDGSSCQAWTPVIELAGDCERQV